MRQNWVSARHDFEGTESRGDILWHNNFRFNSLRLQCLERALYDEHVYRKAKSVTPDIEFKTFQEEALLSYIRKNHTAVIAPTDSGKSLVACMILFWCMITDPRSIVILVEPTIALMKDQASDARNMV